MIVVYSTMKLPT